MPKWKYKKTWSAFAICGVLILSLVLWQDLQTEGPCLTEAEHAQAMPRLLPLRIEKARVCESTTQCSESEFLMLAGMFMEDSAKVLQDPRLEKVDSELTIAMNSVGGSVAGISDFYRWLSKNPKITLLVARYVRTDGAFEPVKADCQSTCALILAGAPVRAQLSSPNEPRVTFIHPVGKQSKIGCPLVPYVYPYRIFEKQKLKLIASFSLENESKDQAHKVIDASFEAPMNGPPLDLDGAARLGLINRACRIENHQMVCRPV